MEDKSREVVMAISNAARYMDPFFKLTAMGTVLLIQYFARMVKEKKLKVTEFTDFQKFLKATDGKYDIMNVPEIPEGQLSEELDALGIHYMVLPDLEKNGMDAAGSSLPARQGKFWSMVSTAYPVADDRRGKRFTAVKESYFWKNNIHFLPS